VDDGTSPHDASISPGIIVQDEVEFPGEAEPAARGRVSRRALLHASVIGGAGIAALPTLALVGSLTRSGMPAPSNVSYTLNADWLFGGDYESGSEAAEFDDSGFATITLPHSAADLSWRDWNPATWESVWIYRRHVSGAALFPSQQSAAQQAGNRVFADFDGVMVSTTVVCNNQVVGSHQGGYLPFSAELTGHLTHHDNVLSVIVDCRNLGVPPMIPGAATSSIDFMQPGGIYRDVNLRVVPQTFISDLFAMPQNVLTQSRALQVQCTIDAGPQVKSANSPATLLVELLSGNQRIASQTVHVNVAKPGIVTTSVTLSDLHGISLWSVQNPALYTVQATLNVPGIGASAMTRRIGFRDATFKTDGFYLNGQRLQLFGLDRHQLFPYTGMAMPARVQRKDAEILKNELNCNVVRCSHYPQSPDFLDACDELGLLVWEEAPGWDHVSDTAAWQDLVVQNVQDMVTRDRSRPSVIIWGTRLNETSDYPSLWAATRQAANQLDPSRPTTGAMDIYSTSGWSQDVFAFNDYSIDSQGNASLKPPLPGVPYLISESVGVVETKPEMHFTWTDPPSLLARQAELHAQAQNMARSSTGYAGMIAWAGFDYSSQHDGHPYSVKWAGVADGFRILKPGAAVYQTQVSPQVRPVIVPVFFWEKNGADPSGTADYEYSMIASNCEQLEISVNGAYVATGLPAVNNDLYSNLDYPPFLVRLPQMTAASVLEIRGYVGGQRVAEVQMSSDTGHDSLGISADDSSITADGSDMTRVVFRARDAYGNQRRYRHGNVLLTVDGPGVLIGDNPFAFGAYGGLGAVWVRSVARQPGTITVTAVHPALGQAQVRVRVQGNGSTSVPVLSWSALSWPGPSPQRLFLRRGTARKVTPRPVLILSNLGLTVIPPDSNSSSRCTRRRCGRRRSSSGAGGRLWPGTPGTQGSAR
jgi:beta-galactosidase